MIIWQPSVLIKDEKFFSKGENWMWEKKCHYWILTSMNILRVAFFCSITSNGADSLWVSLALLQLGGRCVFNVSLNQLLQEMFLSWVRVIPQLMPWYSKECSPPSTVLEIQFGKWKTFLWIVASDPNYSDLSPESSRHFVFRSILPFPVCSGDSASTHSSEHGCSSAPAAWEKWRFRHWTNTAINCNCLVHLAFWYNLNPFYQMQIPWFLSGALNSIFCAHSLSFAIHKVLVTVGWLNSTPIILALKGKLPTQIWQ